MFPFAPAAIRKLNDRGLPVFVVTNQSGVARGYFPESLVHEVHTLMVEQLAAAGAFVDGLYYCPHVPGDNCACRKPGTGMLERASLEHGIDRNAPSSWETATTTSISPIAPALAVFWCAPDTAKASFCGMPRTGLRSLILSPPI